MHAVAVPEKFLWMPYQGEVTPIDSAATAVKKFDLEFGP